MAISEFKHEALGNNAIDQKKARGKPYHSMCAKDVARLQYLFCLLDVHITCMASFYYTSLIASEMPPLEGPQKISEVGNVVGGELQS